MAVARFAAYGQERGVRPRQQRLHCGPLFARQISTCREPKSAGTRIRLVSSPQASDDPIQVSRTLHPPEPHEQPRNPHGIPFRRRYGHPIPLRSIVDDMSDQPAAPSPVVTSSVPSTAWASAVTDSRGRMPEAEDVRRFWQRLGLPGLVDVHTHFMPEQVLRKVWDHFDSLGR